MKLFKKIDIFYKDSKGVTHYVHSTTSYKLVRDAVQGTIFYLNKPMYANAEAGKIGEPIILSKIFGRFDKSHVL